MRTGAIIVPGVAGGQILGGIIPRVLNLRMRGLLIQCALNAGLGVLLSGFALLRCDTVPIAGVTSPYSATYELHVMYMVHPLFYLLLQ